MSTGAASILQKRSAPAAPDRPQNWNAKPPISHGNNSQTANPEPLMDRKAAATYLNVSPTTLAIWDCTRRYDLKPIKVGRLVRYRKEYLDAFLEERMTP